ncbi:MAG TPA: DNA-3-methyladenine glycosylase 2, partial [Labilithrix sp.]
GALDREPLEAFAERLGVGGRHLRRLFDEHLGVSPAAVAQTHRTHFARQLVESTDLAMTEIAHAAGFASVRRFNGAVRTAFGLSPTEIRSRASSPSRGIVLRLPFRPPYDWDAMLGFLAPRAIPGVERIADGVYERTIPGATVVVTRDGDRHLRLEVRAARAKDVDLFGVVARVRRLFDLDSDPAPIAAHLRRDPVLAALVKKRPGLRVPGAWEPLEIAVRAILGQQVTVAGATTLATRLVDRIGNGRFPDARTLAKADVASIGLPPVRAEAIRAVARLADHELEDPEKLLAIHGIGPWTAAYVAMRASRDPDALPASDLGLKRALGLETARAIEQRAEAWRPWRSYAVMHLWCGEEKQR